MFQYIHGWAQDCSNSIANALELLQSCTKPSIYVFEVKEIIPVSFDFYVS